MLHQVRIIVDEAGQPVSAVVLVNWDEPGEQTCPVPVGPFDTVQEVLERCCGRVDTQLRLW